jgi:hypothetical protein
MKQQLLRKLMLRASGLALAATCLFSVTVSAQTFNPPAAYEDTYPTTPSIGLTDHTSAYSNTMLNIAPYGACDLVLAGWDHSSLAQPEGVSWRLLQPGNPSVIFAQGVIPYKKVRDLEVGWLDVAGDPEILVAYYRNGVGHMLDVYSLASGTPAFLYTKVLSTMTNYTRISMDCHIPPYAVGIAWQDVGGINVVCGLNSGPGINFSNILTLTGTSGETGPDLAFVHTGTGLMLQTVYYNPATGNITESMFDFWTAMGTPGFTITPTVNDVNLVGVCQPVNPPADAQPAAAAPAAPPAIKQCPYMNIDGPGHYGVDNWAYTYTIDPNNIYVRLMDLNTSPFATTVNVTNGSLGNKPINMNMNLYPFPFYNRISCPNDGIVVAWYTNTMDPMTGAQAGYIGMNMTINGTVLLSAPDYLTVANNPTWASPTPVLSLSKQDDGLPYMYTVFPERDPFGSFQLENKYPAQCVSSWKPSGDAHNGTFACNDADKIANYNKSHHLSASGISVYPNPTNSTFALNMYTANQQSDMTIVVTDILGVTVGKYSGKGMNANLYLADLSKGLVSGTYLLNVNVPGQAKETLKVTKLQ